MKSYWWKPIQFFFFFLLGMLVSGFAQAKDSLTKEEKQRCDSLKKEIAALEKDEAAVGKELQILEEKLAQAKARFEEDRSKLNGMSGCSKGNPDNSPECSQVLAGLTKSGEELASTKEQMKDPAKRKNGIENNLLTPRAMQKALGCP